MGNESAPNGSPSIGRMVSFGVLLGVIVVIGALFFRVMASFLLPLFLAALLAVLKALQLVATTKALANSG